MSWETVADLLADTAEWINAPNRTKPIVLDVGGVSLVIMPIGADPLESRPDAFRAIGAGLTEVGKYVDLIELMLIPSGAQDPLGAIDVAVAAASDLFSGDMWLFGQPDETLPPMFLIGQDVLWTAGLDFAVPWGVGVSAGVVTADPAIGLAAKQMTDLCTTFASAIYDWSRADGARTVLNAGVSFQQPGLEGYVLFYP